MIFQIICKNENLPEPQSEQWRPRHPGKVPTVFWGSVSYHALLWLEGPLWDSLRGYYLPKKSGGDAGAAR